MKLLDFTEPKSHFKIGKIEEKRKGKLIRSMNENITEGTRLRQKLIFWSKIIRAVIPSQCHY